MQHRAVEPGISDLIQDIGARTPLEAAEALGRQPPATIRDVLASLPVEHAAQIGAHLPGVVTAAGADAAAIAGNLTGTINDLMKPAVGVLSESDNAADAVAYLTRAEAAGEISYFYVTNAAGALTGVVNLRTLILARPGDHLADIMIREPFAFRVDQPLSHCVQDAMKRRFPRFPVIDATGRLVGIVSGWALMERVAAEISTQSGSMVGVDKEERITTKVMQAFRMRHPWLQINLLTAFAAAFVVGLFEDTIAQIVALAVFLPVLAGQSGNTGCQALAITLRGLTLGELQDYPVGKLLRKEILLGAINGFLVGIVAAIAMWIYAGVTDATAPHLLALTILVAMTGACIGSGIFGVLVPLTLKRFGADPATASSIFLTTFTDIIGMGLMLLLATSLIL